jgi:exoribonuclease R
MKHAVRNTADKTADILLATNNRFASFLSEAGRPVTPGAVFAPPSPEDIQRLMRVSQAYGYWNASPAESATTAG